MSVHPLRRQVPRAGFAQGDDFGVTCGIVVGLAAVPSSADDVAVGVDDDGSDGDVPRLAGAVSEEQGFAHGLAILLIHCHPSSLPAKPAMG